MTTGEAPRDHGRLLTTLADVRQRADYGYEPIDVDVAPLLERTRDFLESASSLVDASVR